MPKKRRAWVLTASLGCVFIFTQCVHKRSQQNAEPQNNSSDGHGQLGCDRLGDQSIISQCHINEINRKISECEARGSLYIWENGACIKKN